MVRSKPVMMASCLYCLLQYTCTASVVATTKRPSHALTVVHCRCTSNGGVGEEGKQSHAFVAWGEKLPGAFAGHLLGMVKDPQMQPTKTCCCKSPLQLLIQEVLISMRLQPRPSLLIVHMRGYPTNLARPLLAARADGANLPKHGFKRLEARGPLLRTLRARMRTTACCTCTKLASESHRSGQV